jgi:hypothetical protein
MTQVLKLTKICAIVGFGLLSLAAGPALADGRFTISADNQEVLDTTTNLTWRRCTEGMEWNGKTCIGNPLKVKLENAKAIATSAAAATGKAWRVPTKEELKSLLLQIKTKPKIDLVAFPGTPSFQYWATRKGADDNLNAWLVNFANGKVYGNAGQREFSVRLVHDNK